jgi:hypothetical protein
MYKFNKNKYLAARSKNSGFIQPTPDQIENWITRNFEYKTGNEDQIRICNPDGDTEFRLWISRSNAVVHDFRPNHQQFDGSFLKFVSKYKNITFSEAVKEVCGSSPVITRYMDSKEKNEIQNDDPIKMPDGSVLLKDSIGKARDICMNYLTKVRGFSEDILFKAKINICGTSMIIPYFQYDMLVFWQMRSLISKIFKFPDETETNKKAGDFIYGFDDIEPCAEVIVVESIFNSLSVGTNCTATGGATLKDGQLKLLKSLNPKTVILAPDRDEAGVKSIQKDFFHLNKMRTGDLFKNIYYAIPPIEVAKAGKKDWNDMLLMGYDIYKFIQENKRIVNSRLLFDGIKI